MMKPTFALLIDDANKSFRLDRQSGYTHTAKLWYGTSKARFEDRQTQD